MTTITLTAGWLFGLGMLAGALLLIVIVVAIAGMVAISKGKEVTGRD